MDHNHAHGAEYAGALDGDGAVGSGSGGGGARFQLSRGAIRDEQWRRRDSAGSVHALPPSPARAPSGDAGAGASAGGGGLMSIDTSLLSPRTRAKILAATSGSGADAALPQPAPSHAQAHSQAAGQQLPSHAQTHESPLPRASATTLAAFANTAAQGSMAAYGRRDSFAHRAAASALAAQDADRRYSRLGPARYSPPRRASGVNPYPTSPFPPGSYSGAQHAYAQRTALGMGAAGGAGMYGQAHHVPSGRESVSAYAEYKAKQDAAAAAREAYIVELEREKATREMEVRRRERAAQLALAQAQAIAQRHSQQAQQRVGRAQSQAQAQVQLQLQHHHLQQQQQQQQHQVNHGPTASQVQAVRAQSIATPTPRTLPAPAPALGPGPAHTVPKAQPERTEEEERRRRRKIQYQVFVHARATRCKWKECTAVLDSWSNIEKHIQHAHIVRVEPVLPHSDGEGGTAPAVLQCRWADCAAAFADKDKLSRHCLVDHMGEFCARCPFQCRYEGPDFPSLMAHIGRRHPTATPEQFTPAVPRAEAPRDLSPPPALPASVQLEPAAPSKSALASVDEVDADAGATPTDESAQLTVRPSSEARDVKLEKSVLKGCFSRSPPARASAGAGASTATATEGGSTMGMPREKGWLDKRVAGEVISEMVKYSQARRAAERELGQARANSVPPVPSAGLGDSVCAGGGAERHAVSDGEQEDAQVGAPRSAPGLSPTTAHHTDDGENETAEVKADGAAVLPEMPDIKVLARDIRKRIRAEQSSSSRAGSPASNPYSSPQTMTRKLPGLAAVRGTSATPDPTPPLKPVELPEVTQTKTADAIVAFDETTRLKELEPVPDAQVRAVSVPPPPHAVARRAVADVITADALGSATDAAIDAAPEAVGRDRSPSRYVSPAPDRSPAQIHQHAPRSGSRSHGATHISPSPPHVPAQLSRGSVAPSSAQTQAQAHVQAQTRRSLAPGAYATPHHLSYSHAHAHTQAHASTHAHMRRATQAPPGGVPVSTSGPVETPGPGPSAGADAGAGAGIRRGSSSKAELDPAEKAAQLESFKALFANVKLAPQRNSPDTTLVDADARGLALTQGRSASLATAQTHMRVRDRERDPDPDPERDAQRGGTVQSVGATGWRFTPYAPGKRSNSSPETRAPTVPRELPLPLPFPGVVRPAALPTVMVGSAPGAAVSMKSHTGISGNTLSEVHAQTLAQVPTQVLVLPEPSTPRILTGGGAPYEYRSPSPAAALLQQQVEQQSSDRYARVHRGSDTPSNTSSGGSFGSGETVLRRAIEDPDGEYVAPRGVKRAAAVLGDVDLHGTEGHGQGQGPGHGQEGRRLRPRKGKMVWVESDDDENEDEHGDEEKEEEHLTSGPELGSERRAEEEAEAEAEADGAGGEQGEAEKTSANSVRPLLTTFGVSPSPVSAPTPVQPLAAPLVVSASQSQPSSSPSTVVTLRIPASVSRPSPSQASVAV